MVSTQKILLGEDEEFIARSYIRKLQLEGFTVIHARNGLEVLSLMHTEKPDIVLLDLMMPLKNGFEVLEEIKASSEDDIKKIPIVVTSNLGQKIDIDTAIAAGAVDFLVKSNISLKELVLKVREHLATTKE